MNDQATTSKQVKRSYDQRMGGDFARDYYGGSGFFNFGYWRKDTRSQQEASENLMEMLLGMLPDRTGRVLDVACGEGATTRHLGRYFRPRDTTAVNISAEQLQASRQRAPGCTFAQMDARRLAFPSATFDRLVCVEAAFHFDTRAAFLGEAYRVLRPGGALVLSDILYPAWASRVNPLLPRGNVASDLEAYRRAYRDAGFDEPQVIEATAECWKGFRRSLGGWARAQLLRRRMSPRVFARVALRLAAGSVGIRHYLLVGAVKPGAIDS